MEIYEPTGSASVRINALEAENAALRKQLATGKRLLREEMELKNERTEECIRLREQLAAAQKLIQEAKTILGHSACFTPEWLTPEVKSLIAAIDTAMKEGK